MFNHINIDVSKSETEPVKVASYDLSRLLILGTERDQLLTVLREFKKSEWGITNNIYNLIDEIESEPGLDFSRKSKLMDLAFTIHKTSMFIDKYVEHLMQTVPDGCLIMAFDQTEKVIGFNYCAVKQGEVMDSYTGVSILHRKRGIATELMRLRHRYLLSIGISKYHATLVGGEVIFEKLSIHYTYAPDELNKSRYLVELE